MGILTDNLTEERIEKMIEALQADYPKAFDITEAMMMRIADLELRLIDLEGCLYAISRKIL